ncbi:MAG: NAD(P)/FAD-dependent oxidoreductase [Acidimicrobiales bacterium]
MRAAAGGPAPDAAGTGATPVRRPRRVLVVGAGMVGLSCAWSLQDHGVEVEVLDRFGPAAGASWGNAGYVTPAHVTPLPEPAILRYAVRALIDPRSPVALPVRGGAGRARFLAGFVRHSTASSWRRSMAALRALDRAAIEAYDAQHEGGVEARSIRADLLSGFARPEEASPLLAELQAVAGHGQPVDMDMMTGDEARDFDPHLSPAVRLGVLLRGQRYIDPAAYVAALAAGVRRRGGRVVGDTPVTSVSRRAGTVVAATPAGDREADAVVLAAGAWLGPLAAPHGVATPVQAGRGYSFTLPADPPFAHPVHFPATRLALTPAGDRVRVVGIMELARPDAPPAAARFRSMVAALRPLVEGVDWKGRADDWVGPRPLTADGLPLIGTTGTPGVYVAGGHGMWGITLGPVTGRLLAELVATGRTPPELAPFDPRR